MNISKKLKGLALVGTLLFGSTACERNFEEYNTNTNAPTQNVAPRFYLPSIIESTVDWSYGTSFGMNTGNCWSQQWAKIQYTDEDRYIFRAETTNNTWLTFYTNSLQDIKLMTKQAEAIKNDNYKAIGLVLRAHVFSMLSDTYGDIPFTEALNPDNLQPKYDSQANIYAALISDLEKANDMFKTDGSMAVDGPSDLLFHGDIMAWKKFCNSLNLRLMMRMSFANEAAAKTGIANILGNPTKYPVLDSNDDNAQLNYLASAPNNNPINEDRKTRDDHRISKTMVDVLSQGGPGADIRIAAFANLPAAGGLWVGVPNGLSNADAAAMGFTKTSKVGDFFTKATAPGVIMNYSELCFIRAEAAVRGFTTEDAKTWYENGIKASFYTYEEYLNVYLPEHFNMPDGFDMDAELNDWYLKDSFAAWDAAESNDKKLEKIGTQKWIALYGQGPQAWFEQRRTGYPVLKAPVLRANSQDAIPARLPYPSGENSQNKANYDAASAKLQYGNNIDSRVWWDVK